MSKPKIEHVGGVHPETASITNLLRHAGLVAKHTGKPYSEAMLLGIGGGIGMHYYVFQYKGHMPSFFVSGRHLLQDNVAFIEGICKRLAITPTLKETSSAKAADHNLRAATEGGAAALAWVDLATLPYSGLPQSLRKQTYHVVVAYGVDDTGNALVGDLPARVLPVPQADFAAARAMIGSYKNRLLSIKAGKSDADLAKAVREGIRACHGGLMEGRSWNTRLDAVKRWGELLTSEKNKDGWPKIFAPGPALFKGLASAYLYIEHYGTGGGLLRGLYADFVAEAQSVLKARVLTEAEQKYRSLAKQWSELAVSLLPDGVEPLAETRRLLAGYERAFRKQGPNAQAEMHAIIEQLRAINAAVSKKFPLSEAQAKELLAAAQQRLFRIYDDEVSAAKLLREAVA
jgi:hypothetical protein